MYDMLQVWASSSNEAWASLLVDAAIKGTAILLIAGAVTRVLRNASAAARHLVWLLAMASLLLLPVLSLSVPAWRVLPAWMGLGRTVPQAVTAASPTPEPPMATPMATLLAGNADGPEPRPMRREPAGRPAAASDTVPGPAASPAADGAPRAAAPAAGGSLPVSWAGFWCWRGRQGRRPCWFGRCWAC